MGHESLIMQQSDIGAISDSIKDCLRCGKCKPVCATHVPRANLLYSPRNKILATSLLIESLPVRGTDAPGRQPAPLGGIRGRRRPLHVCRKCEGPCPVKIDFGSVSMNMRNLLRKLGTRAFGPQRGAMLFLNATNPQTIKLMRGALVDVGFKAQRFVHNLLKLAARAQTGAPPASVRPCADQGAR